MADKQVQLRVLTPRGPVLDKPCDFLVMRTTEGDMGILPSHEPCTAALDYGLLRCFTGKGDPETLFLMGGFATVRNSAVEILTTLAEPPDQVEGALADLERERRDNLSREQRYEAEIQRVETALRRTLVRMDLTSHAVAGSRDGEARRKEEDER